MTLTRSALYKGWIRHRRFCAPQNHFNYQFYMFYLDLDELEAFNQLPLCSTESFAVFRVKNTDFLAANSSETIKAKAIAKTRSLGGNTPSRVCMLANIRYWGIKFSPINLYYNYDENDALDSVLVEVSNTPWNQRHYYLIADPSNPEPTQKSFHVSPFQSSDVNYHWILKEPQDNLLVHIENRTKATDSDTTKRFDATLQLQRYALTKQNLQQALIQTPIMSLKIVSGIYWQAAKLALKKARFYPHPNTLGPKTKNSGDPHA